MALCSLFGGISLANAKLGAVHGVAGVDHPADDAPHGAVCAALLAPVVEANVRALRERAPDSPALGRYATVARLLTGKETATVEDAVAWLRETVAELEVPSLGEVGLASGQHEEVAEKSARSSSMQGNPVVLSTDELVAALAAAG